MRAIKRAAMDLTRPSNQKDPFQTESQSQDSNPPIRQRESSLISSYPVSRREDQLLLRFFREGSRQLKLNRASLAKKGAEPASRRLSISCSSTCRSMCIMRDLKSPAPIPDQG